VCSRSNRCLGQQSGEGLRARLFLRPTTGVCAAATAPRIVGLHGCRPRNTRLSGSLSLSASAKKNITRTPGAGEVNFPLQGQPGLDKIRKPARATEFLPHMLRHSQGSRVRIMASAYELQRWFSYAVLNTHTHTCNDTVLCPACDERMTLHRLRNAPNLLASMLS